MRLLPAVALSTAILGLASTVLAQCEPQTLEPLGMPEGGDFGSSLSMDDQFLFVGNIGEPTLCPEPFGCATGALHVFQLDADGLWQRTQHIVPPDITPASGFAGRFSRDGDRLLVGAGGAMVDGEEAGKAYLYEFDGEHWNEAYQFRPSEPTFRQGFGGVVAMEGDAAILVNYRPLKLLLFEEGVGGWALGDELESPLPVASGFGTQVVMRDGWVFVGAIADSTEVSRGGSLWIYRRVPGVGLEFVQRLVAPDVASMPEFGPEFGRFAFDGSTLVVSAWRADRDFLDQGVVFIYELVDDRWTLVQELTHHPADQSHAFGASLDVSGDVLVTGTLREDPRFANGAAYVFRRGSDGRWRQTGRVDPDGRLGGFGAYLATNGERAVFGTPDGQFGGFPVGLVHAYDLDCFTCAPDLDADGSLTIFDFLTYLNLFQDGDALADFDGDGELTIFDFLAFQTAFGAGCE